MKSTVGHYVTLGCGKLKNGSERKNQNQQHVCCKRCDKHQLTELKMVMSGVEDGTDVTPGFLWSSLQNDVTVALCAHGTLIQVKTNFRPLG